MRERWTPIYDRMFDPDHELARGDVACQRWAFADLCHMAQYKDGVRVFGGTVVKLERGCLLASIRYLAERWGWSKNRVDRFLAALEGDEVGKIATVDSNRFGTVYRIVNYDTYASPRDSRGDSHGDANGTDPGQRTTGITSVSPRKKRARPKSKPHPIPDGWTPNPSHVEKAKAERVDMDREAERFRHWHAAKGSTYVDWDRAFHTWLMRARDFGSKPTEPEQSEIRGAGFYR